MIKMNLLHTLVGTLLLLMVLSSITAMAQEAPSHKPRVINTTDLGADPDDEQSMVRQLVCANEFDLEGLIVATGCWKKTQSNTDMLDKIVDAYAKSYDNLKVHAEGFPSPQYLKSISVMGQTGYGMADVGTGKDSPGSDLIIAAVDKDDPRPVWVMGWGGMNNAAQAIWKVRETRTQAELDQFLSKLRLFDILGQDDAGAWIARTFPDVFYIRATGVYGWQSPKNGAYYRENIQNHGPLGAVYPDTKWAPEGDTPAFMHVYPNGLNDPDQIDQGGWGGRFSFTKKAGIRSMSEVPKIQKDAETQYDPYLMYGNTEEGSDAIKRWSDGYNNDFAARMDWSITSEFQKANHHPVAVLNGDQSRKVLEVNAEAGSSLELNAKGSTDPDGHSLSYSWSFYDEPSSYDGSVTIQNGTSPVATLEVPQQAADKTIHIILEIHDDGEPNLYAYRRLIVNVQPAVQNETPVSGMPFDPYPSQVVVTKVRHFDNMCWKIAAAGGTWYFESGETDGKTGFSSAFDQAGNDWIGNDADKGYNLSPRGNGKHEYRGWPNFGNGNFDHPQRPSGTSTRWVDENGEDVAFGTDAVLKGQHLRMRSANETYEIEYHFFQSHVAIKVIKAEDAYAFLYEGPIGGEMEGPDVDKWYFKDGTENGQMCSASECFSPFIYFLDADSKDTQVFYMGVDNQTDGVGGESYVQADNMVVVSYGRVGTWPNDNRSLTGTEAICVFGFYDKKSHKKISKFIESRLKNPFENAK